MFLLQDACTCLFSCVLVAFVFRCKYCMFRGALLQTSSINASPPQPRHLQKTKRETWSTYCQFRNKSRTLDGQGAYLSAPNLTSQPMVSHCRARAATLCFNNTLFFCFVWLAAFQAKPVWHQTTDDFLIHLFKLKARNRCEPDNALLLRTEKQQRAGSPCKPQ